jgi:hypothetical protein
MILESDFDNFPLIEEYLKSLETLKKIDFSNASLNEIYETYFKYAKILPTTTGWYQPKDFNQLTFYRVRLNINPNEEDLSLIRTYSYPSVNFCKENGRANLKGKTVFYCSNTPFAAIFESKPQIGNIGYLSIWKSSLDRPFKLAICLPKGLKEENEWQHMANESHQAIEKYFNSNGKHKAEHFIALNNFIAEQFISENPPYPLSSLIANDMIFGEKANDLLIYPSVASNSYYCNFAIHPNILDNYLSFKKVIKFKVISIDDNLNLKLSTGKIGEITNNSIIFRQAKEDELDFKKLP